MTRDEMWLLQEKYDGKKTEGFFADCIRLQNGEPLAYIIGHIPFLNTTIFLDSRPLIPRTETEFWAEKIIDTMHTYELRAQGLSLGTLSVLDLCAGSGCIGVAVLSAIPMSRVDFCEIDPRHHPTIKKNIITNNINPSRASIFGGDLFAECTHVYDFILTNPPYIDKELNRVEESVSTFEPESALYGGKNGMEIIERIIIESPKFLATHGTLVIEHEPEQTEPIRLLATSHDFASYSLPDQYNISRYTILTRSSDEDMSQ